MSFIDELKMNDDEFRVFNFGYVNLDIDDVIKLLDINENEFNEKYKRFYILGDSYCKFDLKKKIIEKCDFSLSNLIEYCDYRKLNVKELKINESKEMGINTADLIKKLKGLNNE